MRGQAAFQLQEAQESAKRVAAEIVKISNRSHRVREFMEGAFHSFVPATVGPSDATVNGVMKAALNELKNGGLDDDLDAKSQIESTIATILVLNRPCPLNPCHVSRMRRTTVLPLLKQRQ